MAHHLSVDDPADPRLDDFRDLTTADRRPDRPGGRGLVVGEGVPVVERMLDSPYPLRAVMGIESRCAVLGPALAGVDCPVYVVSAETMDQVVGFHLNRGVLATADRAPAPDAGALIAGARRLLVLEGINDHENLGSLFRAAAAFGVDGVLLGARCADPLYRRSVRVSMGHVLRVPFAAAEAWPEALGELRRAGFVVAATTPYPPGLALRTVPSDADRVAVLVGAEGTGLTDAALAAADLRLRIPMADGVDSLNVATAAALVLHHFDVGRL